MALVSPVLVSDTTIGPYAGCPSVVLNRPSASASSEAVGHSCRASSPKWMCAACGPSARPEAARVNSIWLPSTMTIAVPLPVVVLGSTGMRLAFVLPSAQAVPTPTNGRARGRAMATLVMRFMRLPGFVRPPYGELRT